MVSDAKSKPEHKVVQDILNVFQVHWYAKPENILEKN